MNKALDILAKVLLSLLMIMPILGAAGIFPPPTPDLYNTPEAYAFIVALMGAKYLMPIMAVVFALALGCLWTKRVALAALLILPLTVNIFAFHLVLDGGMFTAGAIMGNVLAVLNAYFLWQERAVYAVLLKVKK
jgi:hypothetical protein